MNGQQTRVGGTVPGFRIGHLNFTTALGARTSRNVLVGTSPGRNQMGVVNSRDWEFISKQRSALVRKVVTHKGKPKLWTSYTGNNDRISSSQLPEVYVSPDPE